MKASVVAVWLWDYFST